VSGNAGIRDVAAVSGRAAVGGNGWVSGNAVVSGDAWVYGNAKVHGNAVVRGDARIGGTAEILGGTWDGSEGEILEGSWSAPGVRYAETESALVEERKMTDKEIEEIFKQLNQAVVQRWLNKYPHGLYRGAGAIRQLLGLQSVVEELKEDLMAQLSEFPESKEIEEK